MAHRRAWFFGIGCAVVFLGLILGFVVLMAAARPSLPRQVVLTVRFDGSIQEITAEDPLADLMGPAAISLRELRDALVRAADDERVRGVRVRVDGFGGGVATAQEVRSLLDRVRAADKWTAAYMDTAGEFAPGNLEYYVASACDEVSLNPLGDVNLIGLSVRSPFLRGTFDKLGIRPELPGRGDYKTARFMFTQRDFTAAHREMLEWILDSEMDRLTVDIGSSRGLDAQEVRHLIDRGPHLGAEAVEAGLVDRLEDWGEFKTRLDERESGRSLALTPSAYLRRSRSARAAPKIAIVTAVGAIMRGESRQDLNPLLGGKVMGADTIARAWRQVRRTQGVKAAVFRVDSPGGSAVASEVIRAEMARTAEEIPVVVSMSNVAASGGYWISCGAQQIVAYPGTITGSIGVFARHLNMDEFWSEKAGVTFGRIDRGANANIYGDLEDWNDSQRAAIDRLLDRIYDAFVLRVSESRGMTEDEVRAVGSGRVFTGLQARDNGLVDAVGGFDDALAEARVLAGLAADAPVTLVDFPKPRPWWQRLVQKTTSPEASLRTAAEELEQWWATGTATLPGAVWMPPVYIR